MLDISQSVETPEGVELELRAAGIVVRMYAHLIDLGIKCVAYILAAIVVFMIFNGPVASEIYLIVMFLIEWFYPVFGELYMDGATVGKRSMGLVVVYDDGTPIGWSGSIIRNLIRNVDSFPIFVIPIMGQPVFPIWTYGIGVLVMLLSPQSKRLGDYAAGTLVIYNSKRKHKTNIPDVEGVAPSFPLTMDEQKAIVSFVERDSILSTNRKQELADIIEPLTNKKGEQAVKRLQQLASWLLGAR